MEYNLNARKRRIRNYKIKRAIKLHWKEIVFGFLAGTFITLAYLVASTRQYAECLQYGVC